MRVQGSFDCACGFITRIRMLRSGRQKGLRFRKINVCIHGIYIGVYYRSVEAEGAHGDSTDCEVAEEAGVREGDAIVVSAAAGQISLRRKEKIPTLKELVAQITPENRYDEIAIGPERGKESVEW